MVNQEFDAVLSCSDCVFLLPFKRSESTSEKYVNAISAVASRWGADLGRLERMVAETEFEWRATERMPLPEIDEAVPMDVDSMEVQVAPTTLRAEGTSQQGIVVQQGEILTQPLVPSLFGFISPQEASSKAVGAPLQQVPQQKGGVMSQTPVPPPQASLSLFGFVTY